MSRWIAALALAAMGAWIAYGPLWRARSGARRPIARPAVAVGLAMLRGAAYLLLLAILFGAPAGRAVPLTPIVVLDASASWRRAADPAFLSAAIDSMRALAGDSIILAGDSARLVSVRDAIANGFRDQQSRVQPALDLAAALGRPVVVITDGEVEDPMAWQRLGAGSRVLLPDRPPMTDLAVATLEAPALATGGDTIEVQVGLAAGSVTTYPGTLDLLLDGAAVARVAVQPLDPFAARQVAVRVPLPRGARTVALTVAVAVPNDVEGRNDTLVTMLEITDRPRAVFISTAPDLDVREALRVLRGAVAVPARAYLRVAPNVWREEGTLAAVSAQEVERRAREAGLLVLHGDTAWAGVASVRRGALVLWTPAPPPAPPRPGELSRPIEWFLAGAPASPLSAALELLPVDSLPPLAIGEPIEGGVPALEARIGRTGARRVIASIGGDGAVRRVRISGSGYAAWVQRGGRSADAFNALWGAIFDWASASESVGLGVQLRSAPVRAGEPLRWRRGGADSVVELSITASSGDTDTVRLRFTGTSDVAESPPLAEGTYMVQEATVARRLVVNPSREWVPRAPVPAPVYVARGAPAAPARPVRDSSWPFIASLLLLCAEWLLRRTVGLR
jgi:hypothetical protein